MSIVSELFSGYSLFGTMNSIITCELTTIEILLFKGLVVPVVRNAGGMNFAQIEKEINTLAKKAADGSISIDEMAGGTFTISNGGVYGSLLSTPIINPPQVLLCTHFSFLETHLRSKTLAAKFICRFVFPFTVSNFGYALNSEPSHGRWGERCTKADDVHCIDIRSSSH